MWQYMLSKLSKLVLKLNQVRLIQCVLIQECFASRVEAVFLCLTCYLSACFDGYLDFIHLVLFLLENSPLGSSIDSSIPTQHFLNTSLFYRDLQVSSLYLSIDSPIHRAKFFGVFVYSIASQYLPRSIENFCHQYLLNTSRSIEIFFLIAARYLFDLLSCIFYIYF